MRQIEALEKNSTLEIVDKPKTKGFVNLTGPLIDTKQDWLLKNYDETFAHIIKMNMVRIIFPLPFTLVGTCKHLMLKMSSFPRDSIIIMKRTRYTY
ncbi:hypothetical protein CR513_43013, partial [Mucuna pruriens]